MNKKITAISYLKTEKIPLQNMEKIRGIPATPRFRDTLAYT